MGADPVIREKTYKKDGEEYRLKVIAGLNYLKGNSAPYFSLTAEQERKNRAGRWGYDCGGCCSELILAHYPELAPLAALHLSDIEGAPVHAEENASYYANGGAWFGNDFLPLKVAGNRATPQDCIKRLMRHLRITQDQAGSIWEQWARYRIAPSGYAEGRKVMAALCNELRPRWKREADEAIEKFGLVVFGDVAAWEAKKAQQALT